MICSDCGVDNPSNAKFCLNCGAKLKSTVNKSLKCPECGNSNNPDDAKYCSKCGAELPDNINENFKSQETSANDTSVNWKCPLCKSSQLKNSAHKGALGFGTIRTLNCPNCGAEFDKKGDKYKLSRCSDHNNEIWIKYGHQTLKTDEWIRIVNGGVSDAEQRKIYEEKKKIELENAKIQRDNDVKQFINQLQNGVVNFDMDASSIIIPKRNEKTSMVMNNISLLEPRSIRNTRGGYGGPSIHVAKGVSFRLGAVSAQSESHEELRTIDKGSLILTNKRLIFIGSKRTTNIDLKRILAVKPYKDGIESQRDNKQKTEYFIGTDKTTINFTKNGRHTSIPVNGVVLKAAIMGNIAKL